MLDFKEVDRASEGGIGERYTVWQQKANFSGE